MGQLSGFQFNPSLRHMLMLGWVVCSTATCAVRTPSVSAGQSRPGGGAAAAAAGGSEEPAPGANDPGPNSSAPAENVGAADALAPGDESVQRRHSVLEDVPALDRPVSFTETKIPLGDLVRKVAGATSVTLTAAREVADEPVAVVVTELPARELLEQLAELFDYQWSRQGREERTRFEIGQDVASQQREAALRRAAFAAGEQRFQQELGRYLATAALAPEQIHRSLEAEENLQQELARLTPEQQETFESRPEGKEHDQRYRAARGVYSPVSRALLALLRHLSPQQWAALRDAGQITFSTAPLPGNPGSGGMAELPIPEEIGRLLRAAQPATYRPLAPVTARDPGIEEWVRQREQAIQDQWRSAEGYRVTIRLVGNRLSTGGSVSLRAAATPIGNSTSGRSVTAGNDSGNSLVVGVEAEDAQQPAAAEPPSGRAEGQNDPVLTVRRSYRPEIRRQASLPELESSSGPRIQDLLPDLARIYGAQFISDAYWASPFCAESAVFPGESISLPALLNRLAGKSHTWDHPGRLIRLRSRRWFFDRPREVPLRLIRQWRELSGKYGMLPLETYLEIVTALNDGQLATLGDLVAQGVLPEELHELSTLGSLRDALRLYASLGSSQRRALWQGKAIPMGQMTALQRDLLLGALQENSPSEALLPELTAPAAGNLSLTAEPYVQVKEQRRESIRYSLEPAAGSAAPGAGDTAMSRSGSGREPAGASVSRPAISTVERAVVTRHPVLQLRLRFQHGPMTSELARLTVASPL